MKTYFNSIDSSNIAAIGFKMDPASEFGILRVWFKNKDGLRTYEYRFIALALMKEFLAAESKGKFFASRIKGAYEAHPVMEESAKIWIDESHNFEEFKNDTNAQG